VGLGLGDEDDITVRGLRAVQRCDLVFLEAYTSVLGVSKERLEAAYGKAITVSDRTDVESGAEKIYLPAKDQEVAFLVVGDPLCATTHTDLVLRARQVSAAPSSCLDCSPFSPPYTRVFLRPASTICGPENHL
jgi:diphthine synthase